MKFSIIVISYNNWNLTHQALGDIFRILQPTRREDVEVLIVENGSKDGDVFNGLRWWKKQAFGNVLRVIKSPKNLGFGGGNNLGASKALGENLIFTQTDVRIFKNYLPVVENFISDFGRVMWGVEGYDKDTGWNTFEMHGKSFIIPYIVAWLFGCSRSVWDELGGFDERYFPCDYEDVDLCMQSLVKGIPMVCIPELQTGYVQHNQGSIANQLPDRERLTRKHQGMFFKKWQGQIAEYGVEK